MIPHLYSVERAKPFESTRLQPAPESLAYTKLACQYCVSVRPWYSLYSLDFATFGAKIPVHICGQLPTLQLCSALHVSGAGTVDPGMKFSLNIIPPPWHTVRSYLWLAMGLECMDSYPAGRCRGVAAQGFIAEKFIMSMRYPLKWMSVRGWESRIMPTPSLPEWPDCLQLSTGPECQWWCPYRLHCQITWGTLSLPSLDTTQRLWLNKEQWIIVVSIDYNAWHGWADSCQSQCS